MKIGIVALRPLLQRGFVWKSHTSTPKVNNLEFRRSASTKRTDLYEFDRLIHKCIIPSTWFDCYIPLVQATERDQLVNALRSEMALIYKGRKASQLDALLYDFSQSSEVKKLFKLYEEYYLELGCDDLMQSAREHRFLKSGESPMFQTSVLGFDRNSDTTSRTTQIERAATIIITLLKMKHSLEENSLFPTLHTEQVRPRDHQFFLWVVKYFNAPHFLRYLQLGSRFRMFFPTHNYLDMLSRNCRPVSLKEILAKKDDDPRKALEEPNELECYRNSCHICVISKGFLYRVNVLETMPHKGAAQLSANVSPKPQIYAFNKIVKTLFEIQMDSTKRIEAMISGAGTAFNHKANGIGSLTALSREEWANLRTYLTQLSEVNRNSLKEVESALFVLCLDDERTPSLFGQPSRHNRPDPTHTLKNYVCEKSHNRWFDKSTQIVVNNLNNAAILNNLACCGAGGSSRLISEVALAEKFEPRFYSSQTPVNPIEFTALEWVTDEFVETKIKQAKTYSQLVSNSVLETHDYVRLPFSPAPSLNYTATKTAISKLMVYCMMKFKQPLRFGLGISKLSKKSVYDVISLVDKRIYDELIKHEGVYSESSDYVVLMNRIGDRMVESVKEPYLTSLFDALIYVGKLNNIHPAHFEDPLFDNHIYNYDIYVSNLMNLHISFAGLLPPSKNSVVLWFQPRPVTSPFTVLSYSTSIGKDNIHQIDHYELLRLLKKKD